MGVFILRSRFYLLNLSSRCAHGSKGELVCIDGISLLTTSYSLPLDPVMLVISELLPKIQVYHASRHKTNATAAILDFLGSVTLKEVLPPVPPLNPRKFTVSNSLPLIISSYL